MDGRCIRSYFFATSAYVLVMWGFAADKNKSYLNNSEPLKLYYTLYYGSLWTKLFESEPYWYTIFEAMLLPLLERQKKNPSNLNISVNVHTFLQMIPQMWIKHLINAGWIAVLFFNDISAVKLLI